MLIMYRNRHARLTPPQEFPLKHDMRVKDTAATSPVDVPPAVVLHAHIAWQ